MASPQNSNGFTDLYKVYDASECKGPPPSKKSLSDYSMGTESDFAERKRMLRRIKSKPSFFKEPMEKVAQKILNGEELLYTDLQIWAYYNSKALPKEAKEVLIQAENKVKRNNIVGCFFVTPSAAIMYIAGRVMQRKVFRYSLYAACASLALGWFYAMNYYKRNAFNAYMRIYDQYKDYVLQPQFRTLKLTRASRNDKFPYPNFTSPSLLEMQRMVIRQIPENRKILF